MNNPQMHIPYDWQPKIVSTQVALIGNVVIAGVPGEFTTMSGRRLREAIKTVMNDASDDETSVIVAGLCNTYSDYITTPEEYQVTRRSSLSFPSDVFTIIFYLLCHRYLIICRSYNFYFKTVYARNKCPFHLW